MILLLTQRWIKINSWTNSIPKDFSRKDNLPLIGLVFISTLNEDSYECFVYEMFLINSFEPSAEVVGLGWKVQRVRSQRLRVEVVT